jgi:hypothetical protein
VVDKVKDFFGDVTAGAKDSFAQITGTAETKEEEAEGKEKFRSKRRKKQRKSKQGLSKYIETASTMQRHLCKPHRHPFCSHQTLSLIT